MPITKKTPQPRLSRLGIPQSMSESTVTQERMNERAAQARRNQKVRVTLPPTPWDEGENDDV